VAAGDECNVIAGKRAVKLRGGAPRMVISYTAPPFASGARP
jgi:hypothetical protein